ncbi:cupin domain-containing protein [Congregibacter variabilis]|uniref:Cupin domain-containing protein n=1 Tax=Congregibacter variabilis TaxID=3081200 RepID=A0ABZ0I8M7_9GAMM|nr:cupin domain-containing protein [Congregibacter sp. IMCC43200]
MKLQVLNPHQTAMDSKEMEFRDLGSFDDGGAGVFWSNEGGPSPWEMHPDCDELLHVMEGEIDIEVLPKEGGEASVATVGPGCFLVVPRGCWHRQTIRKKSSEFYVTPGKTLHSSADDPRVNV